jgi:hypothetical protein
MGNSRKVWKKPDGFQMTIGIQTAEMVSSKDIIGET